MARFPEIAGVWAWRHRWQLTPAVAGAGVIAAAAASPIWTAVLLGASGAGMWQAARTATAVRGRMLLSVRERMVAAVWLATAAAWAAWAAIPALPWSGAPAVLAAATAWPWWTWARSRRVRPPAQVLSPAALAVVDRWSEAVALRGPGVLQGSQILTESFTEPAEGAFAFTVQLADDVHGQDAASESARRGVEVQLRLPVGTAALAPDREDATRLHVALTPARHLEAGSVPWPGPEMTPDGQIPIAETPDGRTVSIDFHSGDGVRHGMFSGTSDAGKSTLLMAWLLVGPAAGVSTVWFIDGKGGTSAPRIRHAVDWYATKTWQWPLVIETAYQVFAARRDRRGDANQDAFRVGQETEPVIELWIDESSTVSRAVSAQHHEWVLEMLQEGRALGIRIVQGAQDVMAKGILGGREARDLMAGNGAVIALRPGGSMAKRLTLDSTSVDVDLTALPPEPGFAAIVQKGAVLAKVARIRHATREAAEAAALAITPRALDGPDLDAAGEVYAHRHERDWGKPQPAARGTRALPLPRTGTGTRLPDQATAGTGLTGTPEDADDYDTVASAPGDRGGEAAARRAATQQPPPPAGVSGQVRLARDVVAEALGMVDRPVTRGWIAARTDLSHSTVTRVLGELEAEGRAERTARQKWRLIP